MLVRDLMQREVKTCRENDSLRVAAERMWQGGCGSLPVVSDEGRVVAILTDRDVCMAVCRQDLSPSTTPVVRVASRNVLIVHEDDSAETAEGIMRMHHVRRLPVVDRAGRPVGIVSIHDLAKQAHWAGSKGDRLTPESVIRTEIAIGKRDRRAE
jgi:CBS domain-containing protein